jgi:hypothetical protein
MMPKGTSVVTAKVHSKTLMAPHNKGTEATAELGRRQPVHASLTEAEQERIDNERWRAQLAATPADIAQEIEDEIMAEYRSGRTIQIGK